ncbi:MAG: hypothetical protein KJ787_00095 [Gammaproteobacteria bacterium]|nr:hypothetical protein [Gammaproteobacteria bacterium]MBU1644719.1 hypothetical protein [Gammaproteobacteria bacterium]MBU1973533.1 hypothetical protein [Gammaproteobacteria bacterium]
MAALTSTLLLGGCGIWPFGKADVPAPPATPRQETAVQQQKPEAPALSAKTQRYLAGRGLPVIETRPLNLRVDCKFRDETGYGGHLDLEVQDAEVQRFAATINIGRRGSCRFDLRNFRQTASLPNVTLAGAPGACTVRMWEQGDQVAVAFSACRAQCDGNSFDYLWPILVEKQGGRCS